MWRSAYFGLLRSTSISGSHTDLWPLQPYLKHTAVGLCNKNTGHEVRSLTTQHILCCVKHFKNTFVWWYSLTDDSFVHDTILSQLFFKQNELQIHWFSLCQNCKILSLTEIVLFNNRSKKKSIFFPETLHITVDLLWSDWPAGHLSSL